MTDFAHEDRFIRFSITMDTVLKKIQKYKNDCLIAYGLRSMHLMPMYCIFRSEHGLTAVELAKYCGVDKAFISRITSDLRDLGYVEFSGIASTAHYKKRLCLTEEGKSVMASVNNIIGEAVEKITYGISEDQLKVFYNVFAAFDKNLIALSDEKKK